MITQRRRGAEKQGKNAVPFLCAFAPLREILILVGCSIGLSVLAAKQLRGGDHTPSPAPPVEQTAKAWPLGRGGTLADGVAKTTLPDKPQVIWKETIEKGAFDGTPVIADGVVYLGDMDGMVYAWQLANGKKAVSYTHLTLPTNREV